MDLIKLNETNFENEIAGVEERDDLIAILLEDNEAFRNSISRDVYDECLNKYREVYRFKAKQYLEDSIIMRRRLIHTMSKGMETIKHISEDHDHVAIVFKKYS